MQDNTFSHSISYVKHAQDIPSLHTDESNTESVHQPPTEARLLSKSESERQKISKGASNTMETSEAEISTSRIIEHPASIAETSMNTPADTGIMQQTQAAEEEAKMWREVGLVPNPLSKFLTGNSTTISLLMVQSSLEHHWRSDRRRRHLHRFLCSFRRRIK